MARKSRKRPMRSPTRSNKKTVKAPSLGWFDLPLEMREMVIDRMDPKTRCKFAQCSKICEYEAKKSSKYLCDIYITSVSGKPKELKLGLSHATMPYYWLEFADVGENQTNVSYICGTNLEKTVKWTKVESGNLKDVRLNYLNDYLEKCNHSIRSFYFSESFRTPNLKTSVTEFNIKKLRNLEQLSIGAGSYQDAGLNLVDCGFIEMKQLIRLESLCSPCFSLTFEQFTELKAKSITFSSKYFREEKINEYLKMIKKGEIHEDLREVYIFTRQGKRIRNIQNVMNGLDVSNYYERNHGRGRSTIWYSFNFMSDIKKNGKYHVSLTPRGPIKINWINTANTV